MRELDHGEQFGAPIAWGCLFQQSADEQRQVLPRLAAHVAPGGALLVTVGPKAGDAWGQVGGEPVFHASLSIEEYARILGAAGLRVDAFVPDDPSCARHSVLLAVAGS